MHKGWTKRLDRVQTICRFRLPNQLPLGVLQRTLHHTFAPTVGRRARSEVENCACTFFLTIPTLLFIPLCSFSSLFSSILLCSQWKQQEVRVAIDNCRHARYKFLCARIYNRMHARLHPSTQFNLLSQIPGCGRAMIVDRLSASASKSQLHFM